MAFSALNPEGPRPAAEEPFSVSLEEVSRPMKLFAQALTAAAWACVPSGIEKRSSEFGRTSSLHRWGDDLFARTGESISRPGDELPGLQDGYGPSGGVRGIRYLQIPSLRSPGPFPLELMEACLRGFRTKEKKSLPWRLFSISSRGGNWPGPFSCPRRSESGSLLQREYRGLKKEMGFFLPMAMNSRPSVSLLPFQQAFLESLLRWSSSASPCVRHS